MGDWTSQAKGEWYRPQFSSVFLSRGKLIDSSASIYKQLWPMCSQAYDCISVGSRRYKVIEEENKNKYNI